MNISIVDAVGRAIFNTTSVASREGTLIDVSNVPPGIYVLYAEHDGHTAMARLTNVR
ncbi:MAG: T9SS type A sorting domain-containing protein [Flavobacteriales bacterium]|nr:T9SS type A sorting domain-containing protein [Flavobacteriales bacterium]